MLFFIYCKYRKNIADFAYICVNFNRLIIMENINRLKIVLIEKNCRDWAEIGQKLRTEYKEYLK